MKLHMLRFVPALLSMTLVIASLVLAQESKQEMDAAMQAWLKYAAPGEHHKHLQAFVGSWKTKTQFWPAPEAPPQESIGTAEHSLVLGGRFVQVSYKGEFMEQPFEGIGFIGYDNYKQKYTDVWMDTMGTMMFTSQGTCDGTGEVFTMRGEFADPVGGTDKAVRSVYRFVSPDRYVLEMYEDGPDGKEFKSLEIVHQRR